MLEINSQTFICKNLKQSFYRDDDECGEGKHRDFPESAPKLTQENLVTVKQGDGFGSHDTEMVGTDFHDGKIRDDQGDKEDEKVHGSALEPEPPPRKPHRQHDEHRKNEKRGVVAPV